MDNNVLVVAGMHRSGTSLLSQWLHGCGLHLGDDLLGPAGGNVQGHFEDKSFLRLHEAILLERGADFAGLRALPDEVVPTAESLARMASVVALKNAAHTQWGWKEPRTCLFLDTYAELLPTAKYLMVLRDSHAVVSSLLQRDFGYTEQRHMRRGWLGRQLWQRVTRAGRLRRHCRDHAERYLAAWVHYNQRILRALDTLPEQRYLVINQATLQQHGEDVFNFLSERWSFWLRYRQFDSVYKKELMSKKLDLSRYVKDSELISEARYVSERLAAHLSAASSAWLRRLKLARPAWAVAR